MSKSNESMIDNENIPAKLQELQQLAEANTDESWEQIDNELPSYSNTEEFLDWAREEGLSNESSGQRDLAASIFELTSQELNDSDIDSLKTLMDETDEDNPYPAFRAACALAKRYEDDRIEPNVGDVERVLSAFRDDEDVSDIAKAYLREINS